jgi:hypothetical protein
MPQFGLDMFSSIVDSGQYGSAKRARGNTALECGPFAERYMRFDPQAILVVIQEIADGEIGACFADCLRGHVVSASSRWSLTCNLRFLFLEPPEKNIKNT